MNGEPLLPCLIDNSLIVLPECEPRCTRWSQVNRGEPILIYHDRSGWDPNFYTLINEPDPQVYLAEAAELWNSFHPCGPLFAFTDVEAQAHVVVRYLPEDPVQPNILGTALCVCDDEGDVCVNQADHSAIFFPGNPAPLNMYLASVILNAPPERYINTMLHELGHILGMGHVSTLPLNSVMGVNPDRFTVVQLFDFDVEQLEERNPCDCEFTTQFDREFVAPAAHFTQYAHFCPGCSERG